MPAIAFPLPADVYAPWMEADLRQFLGSRKSEDKHFECKAFLHYAPDWEDKCKDLKAKDTEKAPYHSSKPANSILAYRVIESIIAFANAEGGLLLLGVAETKQSHENPGSVSIPVASLIGDDTEMHFEITGVEPDRIGLVNGRIDEDNYIRQLQDILFPKVNEKHSYLEKKLVPSKDGNKQIIQQNIAVEFVGTYVETLVPVIKLIPCRMADERVLTVAALIVVPSSDVVVVTETIKNDFVVKVPIRLAFNNNGNFDREKAFDYLRQCERRKSSQAVLLKLNRIEALLANDNATLFRPVRPPEELVPQLLRDALENFVPPVSDGFDLGGLIRQAIADGHHVYLQGASGMGKSLLMARTFLDCAMEDPCCYYAIDRTQGRDRYATEAVLIGLRRQIQEQAGLPAVDRPPFREGAATCVLELEYLQAVIKALREKMEDRRLILFVDGLDENLDEQQEKDHSLVQALLQLIHMGQGQVAWVLSSQPRSSLQRLHSDCQLIALDGLDQAEAVRLFGWQLPVHLLDAQPHLIDEALQRSRLDSGLHDPEMLMLLGRALNNKLAGVAATVDAATWQELPDSPSEKFSWLFAQHTDPGRLRDVFGLRRGEQAWQRFTSAIPYTTFLTDLLCLLAAIHRPIPLVILQWVLELEDPDSKEDFRGRKKQAFQAYPPGLLEHNESLTIRLALADLQHTIKLVQVEGEGFSFSKVAHKRAFINFMRQEDIDATKSRLKSLAKEELYALRSDNLDKRHSYLYQELIYLILFAGESAGIYFDQLLQSDFFPEWMQKVAFHIADTTWLSDWLDVTILIKYEHKFGRISTERLAPLNRFLQDWRLHLEKNPQMLAEMLRACPALCTFWPQLQTRKNLLIPNNGYGNRVQGHSNEITCMVALPGNRFASGSKDTTLRIWDVQTGDCLIFNVDDEINCLALLPDGYLASGGKDVTLRIWNTETGNSWSLEGHEAPVTSLAVLHDGSLVSASDDKTIRIWDIETGRHRMIATCNNSIAMLVVSSEGILYSVENNTLHRWNLETGSSDVMHENCHYLASLPDNQFVLVFREGPGEFALELLDMNTKRSQFFRGNSTRITCFAALPDNRHFASSGNLNETIRIWNVETGNVQIYKEDKGRITSLVALPDGRHIASGDRHGTIRIWNVASGENRVMDGVQGLKIKLMDVMPNGDLVFSDYSNQIGTYDGQTRTVKIIGQSEELIYGIAALNDGRVATLEFLNDWIHIWDMQAGSNWIVSDLDRDGGAFIKELVVLPDGRLACGGESYNTIKIWDITSGKCDYLNFLNNPEPIPGAIGFEKLIILPNGLLAAVCNLYGRENEPTSNAICVWDVESGEGKILGYSENPVIYLAVLSDGRLMSGIGDNTIRIWDVQSGSSRVLETPLDHIADVAELPNDSLASIDYFNKTIYILNMEPGKEGQVLKTGFLENKPLCLAYSPQRHLLYVKSINNMTVFPVVDSIG
ncbi:NACHT domain-containing protein [uncultured Desulfobulbus sp.]|uniref:NACHT domain-containing protein n=1 Tax=uncultured Desulfobulbus sp. TaxID=239745 RepID=UPI0029C8837B|nr:NACHT domain-containing protein [uncultured Desulfobulbus sp.]